MTLKNFFFTLTILKALIIIGGLIWLFKRVLQPGVLYTRGWYVFKMIGLLVLIFLIIAAAEFVMALSNRVN